MKMKKADALRKVEIVRNFTKYPAGSVLIKTGLNRLFAIQKKSLER